MTCMRYCLVCLWLFFAYCGCIVPEIQYHALQAFFESTNGELWLPSCNARWNFTEGHDPCDELWNGIKCDNSNISSITLSDCSLSGTLPAELGHLGVYTLTVSQNQIAGPIPPSIQNLTDLSFLDMSYCLLTGHVPMLPESLYTAILQNNFLSGPFPVIAPNAHIVTLSLSHNLFTGPVPQLSSPGLGSILDLSLHYNRLTGPFPGPWGDSLQYLKVGHNLLTGSLTQTICGCMTGSGSCSLVSLDITDNNFGGSLEFMSNLLGVRDIFLADNFLTGPLPSSIQMLTRLSELDISNNYLTGSPTAAFLSPRLNSLFLSANLFSGPLDMSGAISSRLSMLLLDNNALSGQLFLVGVPHLVKVDLSFNAFTGPLPSLKDIPYINQITLSYNHFTGPIHDAFSTAAVMRLLDVSGNRITGNIPPELFTSTYNLSQGVYFCILNYLFLQDNMLVGPIPSEIGHAMFLRQLALYKNSLSGTLPRAMLNNTQLQSLLLQKNDFSGSPSTLFVADGGEAGKAVFPILQVVDLSRNRFTGTIPEQLFRLPFIFYVAIIDGCFTGSIPEAVCDAKQLQTLVLEGLHSGSTCRRRVRDVFRNRNELLYVSRAYGGHIPDCIWNMSALRTLHLSGNLLEGSLPSWNDNFAAQDLSLSFNRLSGTIPASLLQQGALRRIDLSHNKLTGDLTDIQENRNRTDSELAASVNRLSGHIPGEVESFSNLDILHGNLFYCGRQSGLPHSDPEYDHYVCGSDDLDTALVVWGIICVVCFCGIGGYLYLSYRGSNLSVGTTHASPNLVSWVRRILYTLSENAQIIQQWNKAALQLNTVLNPSLEAFLRMLRDLRTVVLVLTSGIVLAFSTFYIVAKMQLDMGTHSSQYRWLYSAAFLSGKTAAIAMLVMITLALMLLIYSIKLLNSRHHGVVRGAVLNQQTDEEEDFFSTPQAYTNEMYLKSFAYIILVLIVNCSIVVSMKGAFVYIALWTNTSPFVQGLLQFLLSGFDILWNGMILTKCISSGHFVLQSKSRIRFHLLLLLFNSIYAPVIATGFTARSCFAEVFTGTDTIDTEGLYSLCTSVDDRGKCVSFNDIVLSTSYVPPYTYSYQCASTVFKSFIPVFILSYTIRAFVQPLLMFGLMYAIKSENIPVAITVFPSILWPTRAHKYEFRKVIYPGVIVTHILHDIAVMMTYGVVSPLCCVTIAMSVCCTTMQWNVIVGRYLLIKSNQSTSFSSDNHDGSFDGGGVLPSKQSSVTASHRALERACLGVWQGPMNAVWTIVDTACLFFSAVFIDIAGDHMGALHAFLLISLPALGLMVLLRFHFNVVLKGLELLQCCINESDMGSRDSAIVTDILELSDDHPSVWITSPIAGEGSIRQRSHASTSAVQSYTCGGRNDRTSRRVLRPADSSNRDSLY